MLFHYGADRGEIMLIGQAVAEHDRVVRRRARVGFSDARHQIGHDLVVAKHRERHVQSARDPAHDFIGLAVFDPQDAIENRLTERPAIEHKLLSEDREGLRQLCLGGTERGNEVIAVDVLHAHLTFDERRLQVGQRAQIPHISKRSEAAGAPQIAELGEGH